MTKKNNVLKTIELYWKYSSGQRKLFFLAFLAILIASFLNSIVPLFLKKLLDLISSSKPGEEAFNQAIWVIVSLAGLELSRWALNRVATYTEMYFMAKASARMAVECFSCLHKHSFSFFADNFSGALVKKVNYFTRALETILESVFWSLGPMFVNISVIVVVLFWRNTFLGLGVVAWMLVFYTAVFAFSRWKYKYDVEVNEMVSKTTGFLADTITNFANLKLFNGYKREVDGFSGLNEELKTKRLRTWRMDELFNSIISLMMIILEVGLFSASVVLWKKGIFTAGDFAMIQMYVIMLIMQGWNFGKLIKRLYQSFSDAQEMTDIFMMNYEVIDRRGSKKLEVLKGEIEFVKTDFNYKETREVLKDFNLKIASGEKVALIGPSGAGKTTIIKILLRNFDVSGGSVLIDGQNISSVTMDSLWQAISLVPQDPLLFHRTLKENIAYGRPGSTEDEIIEASKMAHCHEFIMALPNGYETYVGERGIKLSGGERQRVAIARAILRNSPILILDEATSSLDSESEVLIQDALSKLMADKTVIVIAHRLSTIKKMDRIIFIENGKIKEDGSHEELLKREKGCYAKLWSLQAGGFIQDEESQC
jgi:ATP-binding cassette subfamily B protein